MSLIRVRSVVPLGGFRVRLELTDGTTRVRNIGDLLVGPVFEGIRNSAERFREVRVEGGTLVWPNGADLCPDVLIWGGAPPAEAAPAFPEPVEAKSR